MDDGSPDGAGACSSGIRMPQDREANMASAAGVQHCSDELFCPGLVVETGKGSRVEQLRPVQGERRPGADGSKGDRRPSGEVNDNVPATINESSRLTSINRLECEPTRWLQPAQAERVAQRLWTTRTTIAPVASRVKRPE